MWATDRGQVVFPQEANGPEHTWEYTLQLVTYQFSHQVLASSFI